jgi:acyl-CoA hydrolase/GNAT superfamily N-acetyltransferase
MVEQLPWESRQITLKDVAEKIPRGSNVYIGSTASTAVSTLAALVDSWNLADIQIIQLIPGGNLPHLKENQDRFRTFSFYSFTKSTFYSSQASESETTTACESLADYTPMTVSVIPRLLDEKKLHVDVALIKVTKPHKGFCSLGFGVEFTKDFIQHADLVIAEVNENMPWTEGPSKIHTNSIDWWIQKDERLLTTKELWPEFVGAQAYNKDMLDGIGKNIVKLIPDGATLKFGLNPVVVSVYPFLSERKDLGLHTDLYTESLFRLQEEGVITNSKKTIDRGRTVVSQAIGSQELYDFLDRNPAIEFHPLSYVNDPQVMGKIDNLVAIVGALKIDLTGQVAIDSISHKFYGSVWSTEESFGGARFSTGGKSIVALPSKSLHGRSNVVFALPPGTGVSVTRSIVEYVVTEYGVAFLYGKSIRERCLALIDIAHPDFRRELLAEAKERKYISPSQPGYSIQSIYPQEFECTYRAKNGEIVFVRPIKPIDEDHLRSFFHRLSDHSVYLRYFRIMKSMPQRILQKTADIDYSSNMALVALYPPNSAQYDMIALAQWVVGKDLIPELAFQVRDDWQGQGLGRFLLQNLVRIAKTKHFTKLKADVLADNRAMRNVFETVNLPRKTSADFGVITYVFDLTLLDENAEYNFF